MGAVPYACKGVDMMRPGITDIEEGIKANDFVAIIDCTHKKNIAVGISLFDTNELKEMKYGDSTTATGAFSERQQLKYEYWFGNSKTIGISGSAHGSLRISVICF